MCQKKGIERERERERERESVTSQLPYVDDWIAAYRGVVGQLECSYEKWGRDCFSLYKKKKEMEMEKEKEKQAIHKRKKEKCIGM